MKPSKILFEHSLLNYLGRFWFHTRCAQNLDSWTWEMLCNNMFTYCLHSVIEHMVLSFLWCDEVDWGLGKYWKILKAVELSFRNTVRCKLKRRCDGKKSNGLFQFHAFYLRLGGVIFIQFLRLTLTEVLKTASFMFQKVWNAHLGCEGLERVDKLVRRGRGVDANFWISTVSEFVEQRASPWRGWDFIHFRIQRIVHTVIWYAALEFYASFKLVSKYFNCKGGLKARTRGRVP